ncbi:Oidioi.mRNA.OKI2018_I69.PAR.g10532.t1.cds [Oikopleura dioica]|uniref:Oidioi.mRNA.OKI2018_I69.PAR.g10532.t1.cds n=1 Tax=Oikopleura dioica TaxID=34765 RepID=A0ABN7RWS6_OIKDI|nr:Oidioi.mRNA.OKI2018_I69.PAR.g10532.t1.cds [Oikopleura dioica]
MGFYISESSYNTFFEIGLWRDPVKSGAFFTGAHLCLFIGNWILSKGPVMIIALALTYKVLKKPWTEKIWPEIQTPEYFRAKEFTTLDPEIPPYSEGALLISEIYTRIDTFRIKLIQLKHRDPPKYLALTSLFFIVCYFIGLQLSGFTFCYLIFLCFSILPVLLKPKILEIAKSNDVLAKEKAALLKKATTPPPKVTITEEPPTPSDSESSSDEEEETAADKRRKSDFDPTAEPTWLEDFGHNVSAKAEEAKESLKDNYSLLKQQIADAIGPLKRSKKGSIEQSSANNKYFSDGSSTEGSDNEFVLVQPDEFS